MLIEALSHLAALDVNWFAGLLAGNLMMLFLLFATFFIFLEGKNVVLGSIVILATVFASLDFGTVLGVAILSGSFMIIYYITKISVLAVAEGNNTLKKYLIFINELQFFSVLIIALLAFR